MNVAKRRRQAAEIADRIGGQIEVLTATRERIGSILLPVATIRLSSKTRRHYGQLWLFFLVSMLACRDPGGPEVAPGVVLEPHALCSNHSGTAIATFEDAELEREVREGLRYVNGGLPTHLTCDLVTRLPGLQTLGRTGISSLIGLQNLTNLGFLELPAEIVDIAPLSTLTGLYDIDLRGNRISDISPLSELHAVMWLSLRGNLLTDIGVLSGLGNLQELLLDGNTISDISALSELTELRYLDLGDNRVTDLSPLSGLSKLYILALESNELTDVGPLSELMALERLSLTDNSIIEIDALGGLLRLQNLQLSGNADLSNIQPLLDNAGIGAGDVINLRLTSTACGDVELLEAKGATVFSDCP